MKKNSNVGKEVKCILGIYKSTYKMNAFLKNNRYTVSGEEKNYFFIKDREQHDFAMAKTQTFGMYLFDKHFKFV